MKAKTIKAVLRKKVDEWLTSIEDESLQKDLRSKVIVTGGAIASMLLKEPVNDFDLYFRDYEIAKRVAEYYVARFETKNRKGIPCDISVDTQEAGRIKIVIKSAGIASDEGTEKPYEYFEASAPDAAGEYVADVITDPERIEDRFQETKDALDLESKPLYRPMFLSSNAITLAGHVQLILRFYGEPDTIHANYDFQHCMNYWQSWDSHLELRKEALESLLTKELRYVGSKYPICSLIRLRKFIARGWQVNAGQIVKMCLQIGDLDLHDIKVLEDQLTGVDVAYFAQLLGAIKAKDPQKINSAYLIEIIDRMF
jgi:hypothetical protein